MGGGVFRDPRRKGSRRDISGGGGGVSEPRRIGCRRDMSGGVGSSEG